MIACDRCGNNDARHYRLIVAETEQPPPPPPGDLSMSERVDEMAAMGRPSGDITISMDLCLPCRNNGLPSFLKTFTEHMR